MAINNPANINSSTPLPVAQGGTGGSTELTNGQVWIGNTSNPPTAASLTAGSNISITPGAGTITIASSVPLGNINAWGKFSGTGTLLDSYGVSGVVKDAAGKYTVTLSFSYANVNYSIMGMSFGDPDGYNIFVADGSQAVNSFQLCSATTVGFQDSTVYFSCIGRL